MYKQEKEFNVLKGKIPDFGYDIKMLSVVVDGEKSKTIPNRGLYKTQIDCSNGTRGEWDYNAWNLTLENVSENARCNITFTSNLSEEEYNKYIEAGKAMRRNTYRGKDITSYHTDGSLYEMISSGRFDDIYVGDYITANNIKWLVADIDNYLYTGYKEGAENSGSLTKHHATIIPANILTRAPMNSGKHTTEGGYYNSEMKQITLPNILSTYVEPAFKGHILTYNTQLVNKVSEGVSTDIGWYESQIDLMSEVNVYGSNVFSLSGFDTGLDNTQYAIFQLKPEFIHYIGNSSKIVYWLKNVSGTTTFALASEFGVSYRGGSGDNRGVRPRFLIG